MKMDAFAEMVCTEMKKKLGKETAVEIQKVRKNNGVMKYGLSIMKKGQRVVPTVYLEPFLEAYNSGIPFEEGFRQWMLVCEKSSRDSHFDTEFFNSFKEVRDRIYYRLIGRKGNEELLQEIPYIEFLDLAVCFRYSYHGETLGKGSILIHNSHMEMWGTNTIELFSLAKRNTPGLFPWKCCGMDEMLGEAEDLNTDAAEDIDFMEILSREVPMKVLSNRERNYGAACILYPGVLGEIADKIGHDLFILPSSVHETILLPDTGKESEEALKGMIRSVNSTCLAPEDVLSDTLYRYDRADNRVAIV